MPRSAASTALTIAVRDVFAGARLVRANSWLESANQMGQIIGPSAAGLLAAAGLLRVSMLIDALTFLVALASLFVVRGAYQRAPRAGLPPRTGERCAANWPTASGTWPPPGCCSPCWCSCWC